MENLDLQVFPTTTYEIASTIKIDVFKSKPPIEKKYFPTDTLKWMKANAKPQMSLKLMQVCKYFQHQIFPYFVVKRLHAYADNYVYWDLNEKLNCWKEIEDIPGNLWITGVILVHLLPAVRFISQLIPKIAVCEAKILVFYNEQILWDDFKALTSCGTVKKLYCDQACIYEENGLLVSMEKILGYLPNSEDIYFHHNIPSFSTSAAAKGWILPDLKNIEFRHIDDDFNAEKFIVFMKEQKHVSFILLFISSFLPRFARQLQEFVDEIIAAADLRYPPPHIEFSLQTIESICALHALAKAYS